MPENETTIYKSTAIIIDPQTNNELGNISLVGEPVPATDWISTNGPLQSFIIIEGLEDLRMVWARQEEVLLRTKFGQRTIKIITYPTDGETQGYLDYTSEFTRYQKVSSESKPSIRRGLAYLQSLLGT